MEPNNIRLSRWKRIKPRLLLATKLNVPYGAIFTNRLQSGGCECHKIVVSQPRPRPRQQGGR